MQLNMQKATFHRKLSSSSSLSSFELTSVLWKTLIYLFAFTFLLTHLNLFDCCYFH